MKNKGKLVATSFIAGAAAALYASKQLNKQTLPLSSTEKNSYEAFTKKQDNNTNLTPAEANNFFTKAPNISNNSSEQTTNTQSPNNLYFENISNAANTSTSNFSNINNNSPDMNTSLKIDSW